MSATATMVKSFCYEDLTDEAKAKARANVLAYDSSDDLQQLFSEWVWENIQSDLGDDDFMSHWGFPEFKVHYDLSFSQGCGMGFEGTMDATEVTAEDWAPILAMLGANHERHVLRGGIEVSWPRPITRMVIKIVNDEAWFTERRMDLEVVYSASPLDEDGDPLDDEDCLPEDHPIFRAVALYFSNLAAELYRIYSAEILDADDDLERVSCFFEWQDHVRFNRHGDRIDELDEDEINDLEEEHARHP